MAGEKIYTKLLLGLGLTSFSMHPQAIPEIKNLIIQSNTKALKMKINAILKCNDNQKRLHLIESL
jgi:phosphotransferase system enzyme I (PtsI)